MICPHCGKEIEQQSLIVPNLNLANGCNPTPNPLIVKLDAAVANPFPVTSLNHQALNANAGAATVVTFIKF